MTVSLRCTKLDLFISLIIKHINVKFTDEEQASDAWNIMNGRYCDWRKMDVVVFSPVTDFREARCRDFDEDICSRDGFCNFMHVKPVPMCLIASPAEECDIERRKGEDERVVSDSVLGNLSASAPKTTSQVLASAELLCHDSHDDQCDKSWIEMPCN